MAYSNIKENTHLSNRFFKILKYIIIFFYVIKECLVRKIKINSLSKLNPGLFYSGKGIPSKYYIYNYITSNNNFSKKYFPKTILIPKLSKYDKKDVRKIFEKFSDERIILKPDKGARSIGVFITTKDSERINILNNCGNMDYVAQKFIPYKNELAVFYFKTPGHSKGKILGVAEKKFHKIIGDGNKNIKQLLRKIPVSKAIIEQLKHRYENLNYVPKKEEKITLVSIVDHDDGAEYYDRSDLITRQALDVFDSITSGKEIYFCRFDIRARSIEDFKKGKNFSILEINAGFKAVLLHTLDPRYNLKKQIRQYKKEFSKVFQIISHLKNKPRLTVIEFFYNSIRDEYNLFLLGLRLKKIKQR
ncbi:MAG TPA: hypothetical protein VEC16_04890 [Alphaproteobacteria bacterium]|nr:hypothetical protein [Alphaproteobacteria bacterium]